MGVFFKYLIYAVLIIAVYFILQGFWEENLISEPNVENVVIEVTDGTNNTAQSNSSKTKEMKKEPASF